MSGISRIVDSLQQQIYNSSQIRSQAVERAQQVHAKTTAVSEELMQNRIEAIQKSIAAGEIELQTGLIIHTTA